MGVVIGPMQSKDLFPNLIQYLNDQGYHNLKTLNRPLTAVKTETMVLEVAPQLKYPYTSGIRHARKVTDESPSHHMADMPTHYFAADVTH